MHSVSGALEQEMSLSTPQYYTDSMVSLHWILGTDKSWKPFVQNRVEEIRRLLPPEEWSHCPGESNPADLPSRGLTPLQLSQSKLWLEGPEWLRTSSHSDKTETLMPEECYSELRKSKIEKTPILLSAENRSSGVEAIIKCEDYSSYRKLINVTNLVFKFCHLCLKRVRPTVDEPTSAEVLWITESQKVLMDDRNFKQWKTQFTLFKENKIWRCGGRIQNANVPFSTQHPIILHRSHPLTTLLVKRAHERVTHSGVKATLTELRSKYWIVKGRSLVRQVLRRCNVCRRHEGKPYSNPLPPPLPSFRVQESPPFTVVGVDFAGPLFVRVKKDQFNKVWICLFTCCTTRAVHLDIVTDLAAPTFIRVLKRFSARRIRF